MVGDDHSDRDSAPLTRPPPPDKDPVCEVESDGYAFYTTAEETSRGSILNVQWFDQQPTDRPDDH